VEKTTAVEQTAALTTEVPMDTPGRSHELDNDNDSQKGATEENRPGPARSSHPGLDDDGLPNDPVAITQDRVGANADETQG
jgi:hypothetical protein